MERTQGRTAVLMARFAVLSLIPIVALFFVLNRRDGQLVRDRTIESVQRGAEVGGNFLARAVVRPADLRDGLDGARMSAYDADFRALKAQGVAEHIVLWDRRGTVVWSDQHEVIGRHHPPKEVARALNENNAIVTVEHLDGRAFGAAGLRGKYVRVSVPIHLVSPSTRAEGVLQSYASYAPLAASFAATQADGRMEVGVVAFTLWLGLLVIVWWSTRRFLRQAHRNHYLAHHDTLTGLANRNDFNDRMKFAIDAARKSGKHLALLLVDVDHFKDVNDALGHRAGDDVLKRLAERLPGVLRDQDAIARLGGDEFAVLLPDLSDPEHAAEIATRLLASIAEPVVVDGVLLTLRASIGIAIFPGDGENAELLFQRADVAMYQAKHSGRSIAWYAVETDVNSAGRLRLVGELRLAIERGELEVFYQPLVSLASKRVVGTEALVRWHHPTRGLVMPNEFIPIAEQSGLIQPLTVFVLEQAVQQCRAWRDAGRAVSVAVNVSARSLDDPGLPRLIEGALARAMVPPHALVIEVTETALASDPDAAREALGRLKRIGVRLSLDDFGTGFSSFARLRELPIDELKVDGSFVAQMLLDDVDLQIVRAVIELGSRLGLTVVAEGVESREVLRRLDTLGCDLAQGYLFSPPVPAAEAERWDWAVSPPALLRRN